MPFNEWWICYQFIQCGGGVMQFLKIRWKLKLFIHFSNLESFTVFFQIAISIDVLRVCLKSSKNSIFQGIWTRQSNVFYAFLNKPDKKIPTIRIIMIEICLILSKNAIKSYCHAHSWLAEYKHSTEFFLEPDSEPHYISIWKRHCFQQFFTLS